LLATGGRKDAVLIKGHSCERIQSYLSISSPQRNSLMNKHQDALAYFGLSKKEPPIGGSF
jgi:hypothetical protein